jgi:hypothetical protein
MALTRCNGTYQNKTDLLNTNLIGFYAFYGMKSTTTTPRYCGGMTMQATENWGPTSHGSQLYFTTYRNVDGASRLSYIRNDGVFEPGYGIRFGTTGLTVLNRYEEGNFTPTFTGTGVTVTYTKNNGYYTRVGNWVHATATFVIASSTSLGAKVTINGLPYVPLSGEQWVGTGMLNTGANTRGTLNTIYNNAFRVSLTNVGLTSDGELTDTQLSTIASNGYTMVVSISYRV